MSFYEDVIKRDPRFGSKQRVADLQLLEPVTRARIAAILRAAASSGMTLMVWETYRSPSRQEQLFQEKKTKLRTVGVHHYGLAADLVRDEQGDPSWKGNFTFVGARARDHGLIWGGDWGKKGVKPHFFDPYHVQRCTVARQRYLFQGSWYPDDAYDPYA